MRAAYFLLSAADCRNAGDDFNMPCEVILKAQTSREQHKKRVTSQGAGGAHLAITNMSRESVLRLELQLLVVLLVIVLCMSCDRLKT
eukprot:2685132-Pleurochrysis_carterae.AAC.1